MFGFNREVEFSLNIYVFFNIEDFKSGMSFFVVNFLL